MKRFLILTTIVSSLFLTACGSKEPTEEELARQAIYTENVESAPKLTDEQQAMIVESRGIVIEEEEGEDEEIIQVYNSFSPGDDVVFTLASMTKEELLELDPISHMEIFINGVIRDEYTVAAHTLYGEDKVNQFKKDFEKGLLVNLPDKTREGSDSKYESGTKFVDLIGINTDIRDHQVARHHTDVIISQLNRIFVQIIPDSNFGDRITVSGQVYPIMLENQLAQVNNAAYEFVGVNGNRQRNMMDEKDIATLNKYYIDTFPNALIEAQLSQESPYVSEIGGFEQQEDGTWEPAQMHIFAWNLISLVYGINNVY